MPFDNPDLSGDEIRALAVLAVYSDEAGFDASVALQEFPEGSLARRLAEVIVDLGVDAEADDLQTYLEGVRAAAEISFGLEPRAA